MSLFFVQSKTNAKKILNFFAQILCHVTGGKKKKENGDTVKKCASDVQCKFSFRVTRNQSSHVIVALCFVMIFSCESRLKGN